MTYNLQITLRSDTTFAGGDGVPGLIDQEIVYDAATGLPTIRGTVIKGLLLEECANLLYSLQIGAPALHSEMRQAARFLFGEAGSTLADESRMHIGNASLPDDLVAAVKHQIKSAALKPHDILEALTTARMQTAIEPRTGAPERNSLRVSRVVLRETVFTALLLFHQTPPENALALLSACAQTVRRGGAGRNRGRGRLEMQLLPASQIDVLKLLTEVTP